MSPLKNFIFVIPLLIFSISVKAQIEQYLADNTIYPESDGLKFDDDFYDNQIFFFGFIHGSETPQEMDLQLLQHLNSKGVRYYAPEVDPSLAYFMNKYLGNGDEGLLNFIVHYYAQRVPQDASLQFKDKWRQIYKWNQSLEDESKITVLGFDKMISKELALTHLAYLAPEKETGINVIDSLSYFTETEFEEIHIRSGKPVIKSGKSWEYFFGNKKTDMFNRLQEKYIQHPMKVLACFGEYQGIVGRILQYGEAAISREEAIYENFNDIGATVLERGGRVYCNYGYFHIQQNLINNQRSFAAMIKEANDYKVVSIQGLLVDSECLDRPKLCFDKKVNIKGVQFDKMNYCGYRTSKMLDGDSFFEKVNGIHYLESLLDNHKIALIDLENTDSPFTREMLLADFKRGGRNWRTEANKVTTDYFQFAIIMKKSAANIPYYESE